MVAVVDVLMLTVSFSKNSCCRWNESSSPMRLFSSSIDSSYGSIYVLSTSILFIKIKHEKQQKSKNIQKKKILNYSKIKISFF